MQPRDISEYVDYAAYASIISEDEKKVSLPEKETPHNPPSPPSSLPALDHDSGRFRDDWGIGDLRHEQGDSALDEDEIDSNPAVKDQNTPIMYSAASVLEYHPTNIYHGPLGHTADSHLDSQTLPSSTPAPYTYWPAQQPLTTSTQIGYPIQTPAMTRPGGDNPRAATIAGMIPGLTRCDTCHDHLRARGRVPSVRIRNTIVR